MGQQHAVADWATVLTGQSRDGGHNGGEDRRQPRSRLRDAHAGARVRCGGQAVVGCRLRLWAVAARQGRGASPCRFPPARPAVSPARAAPRRSASLRRPCPCACLPAPPRPPRSPPPLGQAPARGSGHGPPPRSLFGRSALPYRRAARPVPFRSLPSRVGRPPSRPPPSPPRPPSVAGLHPRRSHHRGFAGITPQDVRAPVPSVRGPLPALGSRGLLAACLAGTRQRRAAVRSSAALVAAER